ncbi:MAG: sensor histidine kinase [bacterium]
MINQAYQDHINTNDLIKRSMNDFLNRITSAIMFLYDNDDLRDILKYENRDRLTGKERLERLKLVDSLGSSIQSLVYHTIGMDFYVTLISPSNIIYTSYYADREGIENYISQYTFDKLRNFNNYIIEKGLEVNYIDQLNDDYVISFLKTIETQNNIENIGLLIVSIPENFISNMISVEGKDASNTRLIVNSRGQIIASSDERLLNKSFSKFYSAKIPFEKNGYLIDESNNGVKSLITYSKIGDRSWNDWQLINIVSYHSVTGDMDKTIQRLLFVNLIIIVIFFLIALLLAHGITSPIHKLSQLMTDTDIENESESEKSRLDSKMNEIMMLENSFNKMKTNVRNLIAENKDKEQRKRDAELKALQAQISPHFLFNTLNAVRWAAINKNGKKAAEMVLALINLLKMTIVRGHELITLDEEINNIKNYVAILKLRHATDFEVHYDISDKAKDYSIPRLLLQPIVENAILHGFEDLDQKGIININARYKKNKLIISIRDNGIGMNMKDLNDGQEKKYAKFTGIGVNNVDERIKLYYGEAYGLFINSTPGGGTCVEIKLPTVSNFE